MQPSGISMATKGVLAGLGGGTIIAGGGGGAGLRKEEDYYKPTIKVHKVTFSEEKPPIKKDAIKVKSVKEIEILFN